MIGTVLSCHTININICITPVLFERYLELGEGWYPCSLCCGRVSCCCHNIKKKCCTKLRQGTYTPRQHDTRSQHSEQGYQPSPEQLPCACTHTASRPRVERTDHAAVAPRPSRSTSRLSFSALGPPREFISLGYAVSFMMMQRYRR